LTSRSAPASDTNLNPRGKCDRALPRHRLRAWKILHACSEYEPISAVVEAQSALGMLPEVVTSDGGPAPVIAVKQAAPRVGSLLEAWSSVRSWRSILLESPGAASCEIVHAHCFPAGMAAVRHFPVVVYELEQFIEDQRGYPTQPAGRRRSKWVAGSFEAAERFVISRAAAVVVRTQSVRQELVRRGALAEHIFVIPRPLPTAEIEAARIFRLRKFESRDDNFGLFSTLNVGANWQAWLCQLLAAAQMARLKIPRLVLYLETDGSSRREALRLISQFGAEFETRLVDKFAAATVMSNCSLVVAGSARQSGVTPAENPLAATALREAKPLLAADLACNRDISANGSGCIWFTPGDVVDLARRIVFLASDGAFRNALIASGTRYWREMHDPLRIAEQYDAVYRHAFARRHAGKCSPPTVSWQPSHACI
jgi:glycosyltransferase involved in cell wall biosynthesis